MKSYEGKFWFGVGSGRVQGCMLKWENKLGKQTVRIQLNIFTKQSNKLLQYRTSISSLILLHSCSVPLLQMPFKFTFAFLCSPSCFLSAIRPESGDTPVVKVSLFTRPYWRGSLHLFYLFSSTSLSLVVGILPHELHFFTPQRQLWSGCCPLFRHLIACRLSPTVQREFPKGDLSFFHLLFPLPMFDVRLFLFVFFVLHVFGICFRYEQLSPQCSLWTRICIHQFYSFILLNEALDS